ncbi:MAG: histidine--tRNA ligase [bacterium]|nr:histidine--tRNA ligase [bacterium]
MALSTQSYKGARDFYPEDKRVLNKIFDTWRKVCINYGYEEYDAPIIEPAELFAAKSGDELVNEQSYLFNDRGGRTVMLRPEMTPSVSRMVAGRRQELPLPIRWFSIPNCWRYERPQKGRGREFYQLNVDLFGVEDYAAEVEMLQITDSLMKAFKAKPNMYKIKINSRKLMTHIMGSWLGIDEVEQKTIARLIDRMHKMPKPEFVSLVEASVAPSLREKGSAQSLINILQAKSLNELPLNILESEGAINIGRLLKICDALGIHNIEFDITLIRGLDYYTDFVFEVFDAKDDNNRSMFGGGRYDGLVGMYGVDPVPTVGFAISDVVLMEFLKGHELVPQVEIDNNLTIIPIGDVTAQAMHIAAELRRMNVNVNIDITGRKTDKQLKAAVKSGIKFVLFVGEKELETEQYKLKNLTTSKEDTHSLERIVSLVKDRRK